MIQLLLARTVSSLCNCVSFFSAAPRSTGPSFHYRGFNKTRNDQAEYEIDSLLMEDDLVDELVATPLSAEEIAAKLSSSNAMKHNLSGHELIIEGKNNKGDNWINSTNSNTNVMNIDRNENKINNDWWSDGEDQDANELGENIINTSFFNNNSLLNRGVNNISNEVLFSSNNINTGTHKENDLYFDENIDDIDVQGNVTNNNQLKDNNWDKDFLNNYRDPLNLISSNINIDETEEVIFQDSNYNWNNELNVDPLKRDLNTNSNYDINSNNVECNVVDNYDDFGHRPLTKSNDTLGNDLIRNNITSSEDIDLNETKLEINYDNADLKFHIDDSSTKFESLNGKYTNNGIFNIYDQNSNNELIFGDTDNNYKIDLSKSGNVEVNNKLLDDFDDIFNNTTFVSSDNNANKCVGNNEEDFNMLDFVSAKSPIIDINNSSISKNNVVQPSIIFE